MFTLFRHTFTRGLVPPGLPERYTRQEQRNRGEPYPPDLSAWLYPLQGELNRAGKRLSVEQTPVRSRRWLWLGGANMRCELYARNEPELNQILQGFLTWLFDHTLVDSAGVRFKVPAERIRFIYTEHDG